MQKNYKTTNSFFDRKNKIKFFIMALLFSITASYYGNADLLLYQDSAGTGNFADSLTFVSNYTTIVGPASTGVVLPTTPLGWIYRPANYSFPYVRLNYGFPPGASHSISDDWLISPSVYLESGVTYTMSYMPHMQLNAVNGVIKAYVAASPTIDAMTATTMLHQTAITGGTQLSPVIVNCEPVDTGSVVPGYVLIDTTCTFTFTVATSGNYYIGWYNGSHTTSTSTFAGVVGFVGVKSWKIEEPIPTNSSLIFFDTAAKKNWLNSTIYNASRYTVIKGALSTVDAAHTWFYKNNKPTMEISSGTGDDWLITPRMYLRAGITYQMTYSSQIVNMLGTTNLSVHLGNSPTIAAMTTLLNNIDVGLAGTVSNLNPVVKGPVDFTVPTSGFYYVGFHNYSSAPSGIANANLGFIKVSQPVYDVFPYFFDWDSLMVGGVKQPVSAATHFADDWKVNNLITSMADWRTSTTSSWGQGTFLMHYGSYGTAPAGIDSCNDFCFTPPFQFEAGDEVFFSYSTRVESASYPKNLKIYLCDGSTVDDTLEVIHSLNQFSNTTYIKYDILHTIPTTGIYYFAINARNAYYPASGYNYYTFVDSVTVLKAIYVTLNASSGDVNGTITPSQVLNAVGSMPYTFNIMANPGYWIASITVNGVPISGFLRNSTSVQIVAPGVDADIVVNFEPIPSHPLPYWYGFAASDNPNPKHFEEEWGIFDANEDGITWIKDGSEVRIRTWTASGTIPQNDYLASPPIDYPTAGKTIKVFYKYRANSSSYVEKLNVYLTKENIRNFETAGGLTVATHNPMNNSSYQVQNTYITPPQLATLSGDGKLFLKFWCYSDPDKYWPIIDSVGIENVPDVSVTASLLNSYGSISPAGVTSTYYGGSIGYTFTPNTGYMVESILIDNATTVDNPTNSYTLTNITSNKTIQVSFKKLPRFIRASVERGEGAISPSGNVEIEYGDTVQFVLTPSYGFECDTLKINGIPTTLVGNTYTFRNVIDSISTISISYKRSKFNVTATAGPNGTITPNGTFQITYRDPVSFTFAPINDDYEINQLFINGANVSISKDATQYVIDSITQNTTVDITFKNIIFSVISAATGNGTISPSGTTLVNKGDDLEFTFIPQNEYYEASKVLFNGKEVDKAEYADNKLTVRNIRNTYSLDVFFSHIIYSITTSATAGGSISPLGETTYLKGENIYITLKPDNYRKQLAALIINGIEIPYSDSVYYIEHIDKDYNIQAIFEDKSFTIDATVDGGGTMAPIGKVKVYISSDQVFNFEPWEGFEIDYVRINGKIVETDGKTYRFRNVNADNSIYVYFKQKDPTALLIRSTTDGNGTISPNGGVAVTSGLDQTFTFEPNYGYLLDKVYIKGVATNITGTSYTFTNVKDTTSIRVTFKKITYSVQVQTDCIGGTISPNGNLTLPFQSTEVFKFIPDEGYVLDAVIINGIPTTNNVFGNMYPVYATEDLTIRATFIADSGDRTIIATAGENGTIDPIGNIVVPYQSNQEFTFLPDSGYGVSVVLVDGNVVAPTDYSGNKYTFANIDKNHTIRVDFSELPQHTIIATSDNNGTISPAGTFIKYEGDNQIFNFTGKPYYSVDTVYVNGEIVGTGGAFTSYTMVNITEDMTIHVVFIYDTGIEEDENNIISIFPNPTASVVSLQGDLSEFDRIEILNLAGSVVLEFNNISNQLDLSKLSNGSYTIRFIGKNRVENHSIIKIK